MALSGLTFVVKKCFVTIRIISPFGLCLSESPVTPLTELDEKDSIWPSLLIGLFYYQETVFKDRF